MAFNNVYIKYLFITFTAFAVGQNNTTSPDAGKGSKAAFQDKTAEFGLQKLGNSPAAWADFDNDGWVDLYVAGIVWHNNKGKNFTPSRAGNGSGIVADFDNDGFADIFSYSKLKLYRNKDGRAFEQIKIDLPGKIGSDFVSLGAACGDFNNDGYVDIYVGGYERWEKKITYSDLIIINNKGKSFSVIKNDTGMRARGITACDFNENGSIDVYVSNYRLQPNLLLVNDGKGGFADMAEKFNAAAADKPFKGGHSIGAAWADFDNDSHFDLFAGNFAHRDKRVDQPQSRFLKNTGKEGGWKFRDSGTCGIRYQESYATPAAADYDNDGLVDLFLTTVYATASFGVKNNSALFRNRGGWDFADVTKQQGLAGLKPAYQAAWADVNNDGFPDMLSSGRLFINRGNDNHWLKVILKGDGKTVNSLAIGTQVRIKLKDSTLTRQVEAGTGQGNQNATTLHFGLAGHSEPVILQITWPDGKNQTVKAVELDTTKTVSYNPDISGTNN
jgi:enediyne biosynthesis protein E4